MTDAACLCLNLLKVMAHKTKNQNGWLQLALVRVSRAHFYYILAYVVIILLSDAWNLITAELVWQRWLMAGIMLTVTTIIWYLARADIKSQMYYRLLAIILVLLDILVATFTVYTERGMASRGVALFAIPIVTAAIMRSRTAIFGTAAFSTVAYVLAATRYFYVYFNEGLKIELYTTLALYSASFFILAGLLWIILRESVE